MKKRTLLISALSVFLLGLSSCDLGVIPTSSALYPDNSNESATETTSDEGGNTSIAPETTSGGTQTSSNEDTNSSASGNTSSPDSGSSSQPVTQYTITFDKNGGTGTKDDVTVNAGSTYELPANPFTYEDHTFTGWQVGSDTTVRAVGYQFTVNANTTLKALWQANAPAPTQYTITFAPGEGGSGTMNPVQAPAGAYTLPNCAFTAPSGKEFKSWSIESVEYNAGASYTVSGNVTATAIWEEIMYDVTFVGNGATSGVPAVVNVHIGDTLPLPENNGVTINQFARTGYHFIGWLVGNDDTNRAPGYPLTVTADVTIKANWAEDEPPVVHTYTLYKNDDPTPIGLTWSELDTAWKGQVTAKRGDTFTVKQDSNAYSITAETVAGNNVKVLNDKVTLLTGESRSVDFYLHEDVGHSVWVSDYVENEYLLTIGSTTHTLVRNEGQTGWVEYYYPAKYASVSEGDVISVQHDMQEYVYARNDGADNNINPLDINLINNDAENVDVYLNLDASTLLITGYVPAVVNYTYYYELTHNSVTGDKTALTHSTQQAIDDSGANDQYEHTFTDGVVGGDFIKFYYSTDAGSSFHAFGDAIEVEDGQNLNVTAEHGKFVVIADSNVSQTLYFKITGDDYSLVLGGYALTYYLTVDGDVVELTKDGLQYKAEGVTVSAGDEIVVYKDRVADTSFGDDPNTGNNLNNMAVVVGGTVDIYVKPADTNVWVTGYAFVTVGANTYELSWHDGEGADDYYTVNIPNAAKDAVVTVTIGGNDYTEKVADQANNNVRIKNEETALKVIKEVTASQALKVYPAGDDAYIFLGGYEVTYAVIVTRSGTPLDPINLTWSSVDNAYKNTFTFAEGDVLSATKDDVAITMTATDSAGNNIGNELTIGVAGSNIPMYLHVDGNNYDLYVYTPSYVATVNGVNYTMSVSLSDPNVYEATVASVTANQTVNVTYNNVAIDGISLEAARGNVKNNVINSSGYKVFKSASNVTISINTTNNQVWMSGYVAEYAVNTTPLVAKYNQDESFKEWGANLNGLADGAVLTFTLDGETCTPTREDSDYNNVKLISSQLKVTTGGNVYVALKANGQIWVTGYAQVTVGSNTYSLERENDEYHVLIPSATANDVVTVRLNGAAFTPLTASAGANNLHVDGGLKVIQTVENMTIYVHDDKSVWLDGYVEPLHNVTNYNFVTSIDPGEGNYIFVHSWSEAGSRTSYVNAGVVGVIENATGFLVGVSSDHAEKNGYPASEEADYKTGNVTAFNGDTISYVYEDSTYSAFTTWNPVRTGYNNYIGYKNDGDANYTALDCDAIEWVDNVPYKQYTYVNNDVHNNDTVTIGKLVDTSYQVITSGMSIQNAAEVSSYMTLTNGVVTFTYNGTATLYIKVGKTNILIWAAYVDSAAPTTKNVSINLGGSDLWNKDTPEIYAWAWGTSTPAKWYQATGTSNERSFEFLTGVTTMKIVRINPSASAGSKPTVGATTYNQDYDETCWNSIDGIAIQDGKTFTITGWGAYSWNS